MPSTDRYREDPADDFIPLEQLRRHGSAQPVLDGNLLASVGNHLDRFAEQLTSRERKVLSAVLKLGARDPALAALAAEPPEAVLQPAEINVFERLLAAPEPAGRGLRPVLVLVMKATRHCNLRCTYCHFWSDEPNQLMSFEVLARATHGALSAPGVTTVEFVWHGGEATLLPLSFYHKALWLQQRFRRPGQTVTNALQTNGTHLTPQWLDFIKRYRFQIGVSLDGPPEIHDRRRIDVAGRPTSKRVQEGLKTLQAHGIEYGVLMVVDDDVVALGAERLLSYLLETGIAQVALLNVLPDNDPPPTSPADPYFAFPRHVAFLRELFHLWWPDYADQIMFREFTNLLRKLQGERGRLCIFEGNCMGGYLTVEPMGDVAACDKYFGDTAYRFGNILQLDLADLPTSSAFIQAHADTAAGIDLARHCPWFAVCQGGCPHDRYLRARKSVPHDEQCCGLAPLLSDMAAALG